MATTEVADDRVYITSVRGDRGATVVVLASIRSDEFVLLDLEGHEGWGCHAADGPHRQHDSGREPRTRNPSANMPPVSNCHPSSLSIAPFEPVAPRAVAVGTTQRYPCLTAGQGQMRQLLTPTTPSFQALQGQSTADWWVSSTGTARAFASTNRDPKRGGPPADRLCQQRRRHRGPQRRQRPQTD